MTMEDQEGVAPPISKKIKITADSRSSTTSSPPASSKSSSSPAAATSSSSCFFVTSSTTSNNATGLVATSTSSSTFQPDNDEEDHEELQQQLEGEEDHQQPRRRAGGGEGATSCGGDPTTEEDGASIPPFFTTTTRRNHPSPDYYGARQEQHQQLDEEEQQDGLLLQDDHEQQRQQPRQNTKKMVSSTTSGNHYHHDNDHGFNEKEQYHDNRGGCDDPINEYGEAAEVVREDEERAAAVIAGVFDYDYNKDEDDKPTSQVLLTAPATTGELSPEKPPPKRQQVVLVEGQRGGERPFLLLEGQSQERRERGLTASAPVPAPAQYDLAHELKKKKVSVGINDENKEDQQQQQVRGLLQEEQTYTAATTSRIHNEQREEGRHQKDPQGGAVGDEKEYQHQEIHDSRTVLVSLQETTRGHPLPTLDEILPERKLPAQGRQESYSNDMPSLLAHIPTSFPLSSSDTAKSSENNLMSVHDNNADTTSSSKLQLQCQEECERERSDSNAVSVMQQIEEDTLAVTNVTRAQQKMMRFFFGDAAADAVTGMIHDKNSLSNNNIQASSSTKTDSNRRMYIRFPHKLMYTLECGDYKDILSWTYNGASFQIEDRALFEKKVLPEIFKDAKFSSFRRKLNRWFFKRHRSEKVFTVSHPYFRRGNFNLCDLMSCGDTKQSEPQPSFHSIPPDMITQGGMTQATGSNVATVANHGIGNDLHLGAITMPSSAATMPSWLGPITVAGFAPRNDSVDANISATRFLQNTQNQLPHSGHMVLGSQSSFNLFQEGQDVGNSRHLGRLSLSGTLHSPMGQGVFSDARIFQGIAGSPQFHFFPPSHQHLSNGYGIDTSVQQQQAVNQQQYFMGNHGIEATQLRINQPLSSSNTLFSGTPQLSNYDVNNYGMNTMVGMESRPMTIAGSERIIPRPLVSSQTPHTIEFGAGPRAIDSFVPSTYPQHTATAPPYTMTAASSSLHQQPLDGRQRISASDTDNSFHINTSSNTAIDYNIYQDPRFHNSSR